MPLDDSSYFNDPILTRLRQARAYLGQGEAYWLQGSLSDGDARCAIGAIDDTCDSAAMTNKVGSAMEALLGLPDRDYEDRYQDGYLFPLARLNDAPCTTYHDILALFDRAIAKREAELLAAA